MILLYLQYPSSLTGVHLQQNSFFFSFIFVFFKYQSFKFLCIYFFRHCLWTLSVCIHILSPLKWPCQVKNKIVIINSKKRTVRNSLDIKVSVIFSHSRHKNATFFPLNKIFAHLVTHYCFSIFFFSFSVFLSLSFSLFSLWLKILSDHAESRGSSA